MLLYPVLWLWSRLYSWFWISQLLFFTMNLWTYIVITQNVCLCVCVQACDDRIIFDAIITLTAFCWHFLVLTLQLTHECFWFLYVGSWHHKNNAYFWWGSYDFWRLHHVDSFLLTFFCAHCTDQSSWQMFYTFGI